MSNLEIDLDTLKRTITPVICTLRHGDWCKLTYGRFKIACIYERSGSTLEQLRSALTPSSWMIIRWRGQLLLIGYCASAGDEQASAKFEKHSQFLLSSLHRMELMVKGHIIVSSAQDATSAAICSALGLPEEGNLRNTPVVKKGPSNKWAKRAMKKVKQRKQVGKNGRKAAKKGRAKRRPMPKRGARSRSDTAMVSDAPQLAALRKMPKGPKRKKRPGQGKARRKQPPGPQAPTARQSYGGPASQFSPVAPPRRSSRTSVKKPSDVFCRRCDQKISGLGGVSVSMDGFKCAHCQTPLADNSMGRMKSWSADNPPVLPAFKGAPASQSRPRYWKGRQSVVQLQSSDVEWAAIQLIIDVTFSRGHSAAHRFGTVASEYPGRAPIRLMVTGVSRVQDEALWAQYSRNLVKIRKRAPYAATEHLLEFPLSCGSLVDEQSNECYLFACGIDEETHYPNKIKGRFGPGTYFSENSSLANMYCPCPNCHKGSLIARSACSCDPSAVRSYTMCLSRVTLGDSHVELLHQNFSHLYSEEEGSYQSVVGESKYNGGSTMKYREIACFDNAFFYPEYIVKFERMGKT